MLKDRFLFNFATFLVMSESRPRCFCCLCTCRSSSLTHWLLTLEMCDDLSSFRCQMTKITTKMTFEIFLLPRLLWYRICNVWHIWHQYGWSQTLSICGSPRAPFSICTYMWVHTFVPKWGRPWKNQHCRIFQ